MPLGFRCEILHKECDSDGADQGDQHHERPPRRERSVNVRVVFQREPAEEQRIVEPGNQAAKDNRTQAGDDSNDDGQ